MNKIITAGCMAVATFAAVAVPTKTELERAKPVVEDMTKADLSAYKAGEKTAQKVAAAHIAYAQKAEGEAAKYLLLQGAFKLYARSGEYDLAADTITAMKRDIKDLPPAVIVEIVSDELRYVSDDKAPRLVAMLQEAKNAKSAEGVNSDIIKECLNINATEKNATVRARKVLAKLFPGWSLDTEVAQHDLTGFHDNHRGQENVVMVHPKSEGIPAILSRTVELSDKNPCLFIKVASWQHEWADFLLSVRVNGRDALPNRIICTQDSAPWENLIISLSDWRGSRAKIEVVISANGWWFENAYLAQLEIAEGRGDMRIVEGRATVDGYTWSYRAQNGLATIIAEKDGKFSCAVSPDPTGHITIPATIDGARVTEIGREAFLNCRKLKSVTIPQGAVKIGIRAFNGCGELASVSIPLGVKNIEREAFGGCGLRSITIPEGVTSVRPYVFSGCGGLESVTLPSTITCIKSGAFSWYCGIKTMSIPASVTNIEQGAFVDCNQLKSFAVDIANSCYRSINGLLCSKDGSHLVAGVNGDVTIPSGVATIGGGAFHGCFGLKTVTIPATVTNIGHWAFAFLPELASVSVDENNQFYKSVNGMLLTKDGTVLVRGVNGGNVTIPVGVIRIGDCSFSCSRVTSVRVPSSVKEIERGAFDACGSLTSVTMLGERPNAPNDIFSRSGNIAAIHVPANAKSWAGMKEWQGKPLVFDAKTDPAK